MTATQNINTTETPTAAHQANPADSILRRLATRAMGLTGADIERIVREARLKARRGKRAISYEDIEEGIRGNRPPVPYDLRWRFAFHEAGHAVVHHPASTAGLQDWYIACSFHCLRSAGPKCHR